MTAGSGILHQEMPKGDKQGRMHGFQLWANLPSSLKMTDPRYQDIPSSAIPEVADDDGTRVRVICGEFWAKRGRGKGELPIRITSAIFGRLVNGNGSKSALRVTRLPTC